MIKYGNLGSNFGSKLRFDGQYICLSEKLLEGHLHKFGWNLLLGCTEASDVFLKIRVHVLKDQIKNCLPFFVLALYEIQQPGIGSGGNKFSGILSKLGR